MKNQSVIANSMEMRRLRKDRGWTQSVLAQKIGCNTRTIQKAEGGKPISQETIDDIAQAFNVPVETLVLDHVSNRMGVSAREGTTGKEPVSFRMRGAAPGFGHKLFGREKDFHKLKAKLIDAVSDEASGVVVLQGDAGVGKSSLMNRLAHDESFGEVFPDHGLWTAVGNRASVAELLRSWGRSIRLPDHKLVRIDELIAALRAKLHHKRMLLFVDDVWSAAEAECFRLVGRGSVVLYSTRIPLLADQIAPGPESVYILSGLEKPFDLELLASLAPDAVETHRDLCDDLVTSVSGLPLAILVAGKMLHREHIAGGDVRKLLEAIREDARTLLEQPVPPDMADLLNQTTPDVAAVLRRSTCTLSQEMKEQFAKLGNYPASPGVFPLRMLARTWRLSLDDAKGAARKFVDLGLLNVAKRGHYQIHPLIRALALYEWDQHHERRNS